MAQLFGHEDLDVYQAALQLVAWLESMFTEFSSRKRTRTVKTYRRNARITIKGRSP